MPIAPLLLQNMTEALLGAEPSEAFCRLGSAQGADAERARGGVSESIPTFIPTLVSTPMFLAH
jgi:hypothetical protein